MRKLLSSICATALAASFALSSALPLNAAPMFVPATANTRSDVLTVQYDANNYIRPRAVERWGGRIDRGWDRRFDRVDRRWDRRVDRWDRRWDRRVDRWDRRDFHRYARRGDYYNGYRGYRYYRPGYRRHGDFWFPAAAFLAGALITGAIANQPRSYYRGGSAHEQWCYNRYRSYRAWDNTFQPYNGPRRQCYSPYS